MVKYAQEYFKLLAKVVAVPGTDDPDIFTISATDDHHMIISVDRVSGNGTVYHFYHRVFSDDVTSEIQLFGLDKDDRFRFDGQGNPSINIRIVGGAGHDIVMNETDHIHPIVYDVPEGMQITGNPVTERLNNKPFNNTYDRTDYSLNKFFHFPAPAFYTDEGLGLTYNLWWTRFGFRSDPFKSRHTLSVSYFFNNDAFIGKYSGDWFHAIGDIDLGLDAFVTAPTFTQYFYGLGNEYIDYGGDKKYHIVKGSQIRLAPSLNYRFGFGSRLFISPSYQYLDLKNSDDTPRFVYDSALSKLTPEDFGYRHYMGLSAGYKFERLDNNNFPTRGGSFELTLGGRNSLSNTSIHHGFLSAKGSLYIPFDVTGTFVYATHVQADKIFGDYEFFDALTFGGTDKFRGLRRDRLAGNAFYYQASDLRWTLLQVRGMVAFSFGIYGSFDYGRVWYEGDDASADKWHTAFGGGIFIVPLGVTAFRIGYITSENDHQINLGGTLKF